tara:strand:- start:16 stop:198 length:183 start_codon:yes stop_codon:yes gene_type:complete
MAKISDQRNGGPNCYYDMKLGVIPRNKVDATYLAKLDVEYAKLSPKQKQSFWRTHSISAS